MVLQCKPKASLLELFKSHAGGSAPDVAVQTQAPTPPSDHTSSPPFRQVDKKRKRNNKGKNVFEQGKIVPIK